MLRPTDVGLVGSNSDTSILRRTSDTAQSGFGIRSGVVREYYGMCLGEGTVT